MVGGSKLWDLQAETVGVAHASRRKIPKTFFSASCRKHGHKVSSPLINLATAAANDGRGSFFLARAVRGATVRGAASYAS